MALGNVTDLQGPERRSCGVVVMIILPEQFGQRAGDDHPTLASRGAAATG
jgi:hypothetical protein